MPSRSTSSDGEKPIRNVDHGREAPAPLVRGEKSAAVGTAKGNIGGRGTSPTTKIQRHNQQSDHDR